MTTAGVLVIYAGLLATLGPLLLLHRTWTARSPRLAIFAWQSLSAAVVLAVILAGLSLALHRGLTVSDLDLWMRACLVRLRDGYGTSATGLFALLGMLSAISLLGRVAGCLVFGLYRARRARQRHADSLTLLARRTPGLDAVVIDDVAVLAYCLPGKPRRIVLTTAALTELSEPELRAVLAHEQAHLAGRHHLVVALADALARSFPWLRLFCQARVEIGRLLEMLADDAASKGHGRRTVATAIVVLADGSVPASAMSAGGSTALARAGRLLVPLRPVRLRFVLAGFVLAAAVGLVPVVVAVAPTLAASSNLACP